ncbi:alpha/beta hydrolase [Branchiibius sp. NY16-3462-2]|uniref:alpha/beta hydrolase n=1 Tax=Branchiibius sp. NY16-3462-2 TaxID=1807500 RepID=UPI00079866FF|nr:alpha/beta hydrolase [Branchiibius sp. NY16-3462-2]KYH43629.1 hypothetical protein AZH51_02120 [Branchiibius sp. NY16-3462-2]
MRALPALVLALLIAGLAAGCGSGSAGPPATQSVSPTIAATSSNAPAAVVDPATRCKVKAPGKAVVTSVPVTGGGLTVASVGAGRRVGVLLHQSDGDLCQWWPYAARWARGDIRLIVVDQCGFGQSQCTATPRQQVDALVAFARRSPTTSVTLVGASMGGTIALAEGQPAGADAVVDLSGPPTWYDETPAEQAAARTTVPLLVACSATDTNVSPSTLQAAVQASPARPKLFSSKQRGHGVDMLVDLDGQPTPLAGLVRDWIAGDRRTSI